MVKNNFHWKNGNHFKYKSSTFIVEHHDNEYKISIKDLGEVLTSYTKIHNKGLYTQKELKEIKRIIERPHGWIETYYEIYDPLSIDKLQN